jgi:hypothetical protein
MKKIFLFTIMLIALKASGQYSNYYNVNKNIGVSGSLNFNTIDYGTLALANAQKERNNFEKQKYNDEKLKALYATIADNPALAYDYCKIEEIEKINEGNLRRLFAEIRVPEMLFDLNGEILRNVSLEGIVTEVNFLTPTLLQDPFDIELEFKKSIDSIEAGKLNTFDIDWDKPGKETFFAHKKYLNIANVWEQKGYKATIIYENDYTFNIADTYGAVSQDGILFLVTVDFYGDKNSSNFESIEGRRYYFKNLLERIIANARVTGFKK